jgi:phosphate-selective porin OprO and OprP
MRIAAGWKVAGAASVLVVSSLGVARADNDTSKEKQLETRVNELERQLAEVNRRLAQSGTNASGDELEARVTELEKLTKKDKEGLFPFWKNGLRLESAASSTKLHIGGFIQNDWNFFAHNQDFENAFGRQFEAGTQFRRARLMIEGTIYKNVDFKAEYDFAGGAVAFRNVWMAFRGLPMGTTLTVGSMKQPFGLEELTPDLFVSFMERSAPSTAFAPAYDTGFQLSNTFADERGSWQFGAFREAGANGDDTGNARSGEWNLAARVAGRPWMSEDKNQFVHLGAAVLFRQPANDAISFKSTPELNQAGTVVDTGTIGSHKTWVFEGESAYQNGPFTVIGEYYMAQVDAMADGDPTFSGWSLEGSFFLTDDHRGYNAGKATFDRVVPKKNWEDGGGCGAWQLVGRIDGIDLNDAGVEGGKMRTISLGVNWYANPNTKVMVAIVRPRVNGIGSMWGLEARFQVDF